MSQLAKILGTYAPGHGLDHGGKTYVFQRVSQAMKAALAAAYFKRCREAVYAMRGEVPDGEYDRQLTAVATRHSRGEYDFRFGSESFSFFMGGGGFCQLVAAVTGCTPDEAETLTEERDADVQHVVLCVVMESFPDLKKKLLLAERKGLLTPEMAGQLARLELLLTQTKGPPPIGI